MPALTPNPKVYPVCSVCDAPYVLRRAMSLTGKTWETTWAWFRDCEPGCKRKHKKAVAKLVDLRRGEQAVRAGRSKG